MTDREQTRRDAEEFASIEHYPSGTLAQHCLALLSELEQAERRVVDGAWDRARLVEQLEQAERERDEAREKLAVAYELGEQLRVRAEQE